MRISQLVDLFGILTFGIELNLIKLPNSCSLKKVITLFTILYYCFEAHSSDLNTFSTFTMVNPLRSLITTRFNAFLKAYFTYCVDVPELLYSSLSMYFPGFTVIYCIVVIVFTIYLNYGFSVWYILRTKPEFVCNQKQISKLYKNAVYEAWLFDWYMNQ